MTNQGSFHHRFLSRSHPIRSRVLLLHAGLTLFLVGIGSVGHPLVRASSVTRPVAAASFQIAQARTLYVNSALGNDSGGAGTSESVPYRTINYALQQAQPGTVIRVAPGSYTSQSGEVFPLLLKEGVSLQGDESTKGQRVLVIGSGIYISPSFARQNVTIRAVNNSELRGFTVTNPQTRGTALWVESASPSVSANTFSNSLRDGIFITGNSSPKIFNNVFIKNQGNGIAFARSGQGEVRSNLFQDTGFGIAIGGTASPLVDGNQVTQNNDGIVVSNSARPVLRNNVIENNVRDGVVAIADAQPDLGVTGNPGNNIIRNNRRYSIYNATAKNTIAAVGNNVDIQKISGKVDFVAANVQPPGSGSSQFRDVQGHWAQAYIEALASRGIISGFRDGTYRPNDPVTRAQFASIISKAFTPAPQRARVNFSDVQTNFWGFQVIETSVQGGFLSGYPDGLFLPDQQIPRVQVLVSLASGLGFQPGSTNLNAVFQDAPQIPSYAISPVASATQRRIVVNYPNPKELNPNRAATRAEVAAFVYQALVNTGKADALSSPYLVTLP